MAVESRIIFRSDASEVRRDVSVLKAARRELEGLKKGSAVEDRISLINAKANAQARLVAQKAIAGVVERRQRSEIANDREALKNKRENVRLEQVHARAVAAREKRSETAAGKELRMVKERSSIGGARSAVGGGLEAAAGFLPGGGVASVLQGAGVGVVPAALIGGAVAGAGLFGGAVIQAQAYREDVMRALTTLVKSRQEAERVGRLIGETADFIGASRTEIAGKFVDLLPSFDVGRADEIIRRMKDLATVNPQANLEGLTSAITKIASTGKLQGDELDMLAENGLSAMGVYRELAKQLNKTVPEIIKMKEAGKIGSDVAVQAILDSIKTQTGGKAAGVAASEKSLEDISGLIERIKAIPSNVLFDLDVGSELGSIKGVMREVIEFFSSTSDSGKEVRAVVGDVFKELVGGLLGVDLDKGGSVKETLTAMLEGIKESKGEIREFAEGVRVIAGGISSFIRLWSMFAKTSGESGASFDAITQKLGGWGTGAKFVLGPLVTLLKVATSLADLSSRKLGFDGLNIAGGAGDVVGFLAGIPGSIAEFAVGMFTSGESIIDGLVNGIRSKASSVVDAVVGAVSAAVQAGRKFLGIASPSRVFMEIGAYASEGMSVGIRDTIDLPTRAANDMAKAATDSGSVGFAGSASSAGGGAGASVVYAPVVHVNVANASEIEAGVRKALAADRAQFDIMLDDALLRRAS